MTDDEFEIESYLVRFIIQGSNSRVLPWIGVKHLKMKLTWKHGSNFALHIFSEAMIAASQ